MIPGTNDISAVVIVNSIVYNDINVVIENRLLGGFTMSDMNTLLKMAIDETAELSGGEIFLLCDLFKRYEWNRISRSSQLLLGTLFLDKISNESLGMKASVRTSSGQQKYQIVRRSNRA